MKKKEFNINKIIKIRKKYKNKNMIKLYKIYLKKKFYNNKT